MHIASTLCCWFAALSLLACSEQTATSPSTTGAPDAAETTPTGGSGHSGKVIELGDATIGSFAVHATRDQGEIVPGKDAPIDVTVKAVAGSSAQVGAVRFWIGLEDAKVSVKARAEIEDPAAPDRWHTHAEIPSPLPEGSRLWVEIETSTNERAVGSFDLAR